MEMMGHMIQAYECMTGENMTMEMMDKAMKLQPSEEYEQNKTMDLGVWKNMNKTKQWT